jgi:hypothetical protein
MDQATLNKIVADHVAKTADLLVKKNAEYAGSADCLANFKRNATKNSQTVLDTWAVYWGKHIDSINTYITRVKDTAVRMALADVVRRAQAGKPTVESDKAAWAAVTDPASFRAAVDRYLPEAVVMVDAKLSEPIEGRFDDNINYSFLCMAILQELREQAKPEVNLFKLAAELRDKERPQEAATEAAP